MNIRQRLGAWLGKSAGPITSSEALWREMHGGGASKAGVRVNLDTALQVTTVLACVRVIAEGVAQLPLKVYRLGADGRSKTPAVDHPLHELLHRRPNEWQTSFELRETLTAHAVLTGNGYAFIEKTRGQVSGLLPLDPGRMTVTRAERGWAIGYDYRPDSGAPESIPAERVLHLRGPSWNGYLGLEPFRLAREAIGLAIATEEHAGRLHGNGARPGGVLSTEQALNEEAVKRIKESWQDAFVGANAYKTAILEAGLKWTPLAMTGVDAQHLETRRLQVEEICRALRVFPQMVGHAEKTATYASAEQFFLAHVIHSLGPWIERWEEVATRALLGPAETGQGYFIKHNVTALLRGDAVSRAGFYSRGILDGWMTRNEARSLEDLNPLDGLDEPLRPLNMGRGSEPPPESTPAPAPPAAGTGQGG